MKMFSFWNSHNTKLTILKLHSSIAFSTFAVLCSHHLYLIAFRCRNTTHRTLQRELFPFSPFPQPLETTNLLSIYMDLPVLAISYKWNWTLHDSLCLVRHLFLITSHLCFQSSLIVMLGEVGCYGCVNISLMRTPKKKTSWGIPASLSLLVGFSSWDK